MRISIIIVTWRAPRLLRRCLASLRRHARGLPVTVVDNGREEPAAGRLRRDFPEVAWIDPGRNTGFAGGCNLGLEAGGADLTLFLNPDVEATHGSVQALAATLAADPGAALAGGLLVDGGGRPQARYAPRPLPSVAALARRALLPDLAARRRPTRLAPGGTPVAVEQLAGACLMARRDALQAVGGFDPGFWPVWFEDVDLCLRLRLAGHRILHVPAAVFRHQGGGSVARMEPEARAAAWYGNLHRYTRKHHGPAAAALVRACTLPGSALRLAATLAGAPGEGGRARRAAACVRVAARSVGGWPSASQSTS